MPRPQTFPTRNLGTLIVPATKDPLGGSSDPSALHTSLLILQRDLNAIVVQKTLRFELPVSLTMVSVLFPFLGIKAEARNVLVEFERVLRELDHRPLPQETIADIIEKHIGVTQRGAGNAYFRAFSPRGAGDLHLRCRRPDLVVRANAILAQTPPTE